MATTKQSRHRSNGVEGARKILDRTLNYPAQPLDPSLKIETVPNLPPCTCKVPDLLGLMRGTKGERG